MIYNTKSKYFTINEYLKLLKDKNTICVKDYKKNSNGIINRHDVDFSLEMAFKFSEYEKRNNINSTYYLLISSDLYNVFSPTSKEYIEKMISNGFEIGIHFDPTIYGNLNERELIDKMLIEINIFEQFYNYKIFSYSMHNPSLSGIYINYKELINAYDNEIFCDKSYISDSSYSFRNKNPYEFLEMSNNNLIQLLTHPVHFFGNSEISYEKQINEILNNFYYKLDANWNLNKVYLNTKKNYNIKVNNV